MPAKLLIACSILFSLAGCSPLSTRPPEAPESNQARLMGLLAKAASLPPAPPPSHDRLFRPDLMVLPFAEVSDDRVVLRNIRDCHYRTEDDYDVRHFDREIPLSQVQTLDFIVVPFKNAPSLAHTMLSFGLTDGEYIVLSVEARLESQETYNPIQGAMQAYELMWVVGTERDLIALRTEVRQVEVFLYRTRAQPEQVRNVFLAAVARVNEIHRQPEYYDTLRNNCTTNIVDLVNRLRPGTIPEDIRILLPGHSDRLLYDHGLLAMEGPFAQIKQASRINLSAKLNYGSADFSKAIRGESVN
jgi:hypothetical protein